MLVKLELNIEYNCIEKRGEIMQQHLCFYERHLAAQTEYSVFKV